MRVVHHMAESLRAGDVVAVFPEGTTSDGTALLPFHANLIQAAISADAPVQPVALRFVEAASGQTSSRRATSATTRWSARSGARCARRRSWRSCVSASRKPPAGAIAAPGRRSCTTKCAL